MQDSTFGAERTQINYPNWALFESTDNAYQVIVDMIIPRSPLLAYEFGIIQYYGALDAHIDEFIILRQESLGLTPAIPIAELLDIASQQALLPDSSFDIISVIPTTMMGYYSEWYGYGSTRLNEPNQRVLEFYPFSWKQVGYPGPSLGYHALRAYNFT